MASSFPVPFVHENPSGWGPPAKEVDTETMRLSHIYAPFGRNDRLGRAADFTSQPSNQFKQRYDRRRYDEYGRNAEFQYKVEGDDFELVDTAKASVKRFVTPSAKKRTAAQNRLKQLNARSGGRESSYDPRNSQQFQRTRRGTGRGMPGGRGGPGRGMTWRDRLDRQASVSIKSDWKLIADLDLIKITKQPMNTSKPQKEEDLLFCGFVDTYNDNYEKCTTKVPTPLKRFENKEFYPVTTTDDPVIEKVSILAFALSP
jgi:translation initiation factor 3 subunit D